MSRYIDADATLKIIKKMLYETALNNFTTDRQFSDFCEEIAQNRIATWISIVPTADVVEVVRCRDCRWNYIHVTPKGNDYHICKLLNLAFDNDDNFFCAYGEKKSESVEPISQWRGCYDGTIPYFDGKEVEE